MAGIQLPIKLNNYINIFNKEFAGKLPPNHLKDYIIKIYNKNPLYGPLYNFSIRELEVFHQYLNKILKKGWIRSFTNPIKTPKVAHHQPGHPIDPATFRDLRTTYFWTYFSTTVISDDFLET